MDAFTNTTSAPLGSFSGRSDQQVWYNDRQYFLLASTGCIVFLGYLLNSVLAYVASVKAPIVGYRHFLEPGWIVGVRFGRQAGPMIREGYSKVRLS